jgi:hypothetical protein
MSFSLGWPLLLLLSFQKEGCAASASCSVGGMLIWALDFAAFLALGELGRGERGYGGGGWRLKTFCP